jgi:hypothetical protein
VATDAETRQYAAQLLRRHFDGSVTPDVLVENFGASPDPLIRMALDVAAQQPRRGFLGVSERHWNGVFWPRMEQLILELEKGDGGVAPSKPPYPVASTGRLVGLLLFAVFVIAVAGDHASRVWKHVNGTDRLTDMRLLVELVLSAFFGLAALAAVANLVRRTRLRFGKPQGGASGAA